MQFSFGNTLSLLAAFIHVIFGASLPATVPSSPSPSSSSPGPSLSSVTCPNGPPPTQALHQQWAQHVATETKMGHESMYLATVMRTEQIKQDLIESDELAKERVFPDIPLFGIKDSSKCDVEHIQGKASLQDRSYCPYYNVINYSQTRYPSEIAEARCRCSDAVGLSGYTCEEVHYNIRVLRQTETCDTEGHYTYRAGWQRVSVGCTPVKTV